MQATGTSPKSAPRLKRALSRAWNCPKKHLQSKAPNNNPSTVENLEDWGLEDQGSTMLELRPVECFQVRETWQSRLPRRSSKPDPPPEKKEATGSAALQPEHRSVLTCTVASWEAIRPKSKKLPRAVHSRSFALDQVALSAQPTPKLGPCKQHQTFTTVD